MTDEPKFKVGDTVEWTSQSSGVSKTKRGLIVLNVPKSISPGGKASPPWAKTDYLFWRCFPNASNYSVQFDGWARNHESYIVKVGNKYYWPRVSQLKKI